MTSAAQIAENRRTLAEIRRHMTAAPEEDDARARVTIVLEGARPTGLRVTIEQASQPTPPQLNHGQQDQDRHPGARGTAGRRA